LWFTTGIASGGVGVGFGLCFTLCETERWRRRFLTGGFGSCCAEGHANPALVTTQFDAHVTPAAETTHEGLPWQIRPALEREQPELPP
jgi:hypothetical protein